MKGSGWICLMLLVLAGYSAKSQSKCDSILLIADYDAAIGYHDGANTAGNNYGTAVQNAAYLIPGVYGPYNCNRALIHFNLSALPSSATITAAKLDLYSLNPVGTYSGHCGPNNAAYLQRVTGPWSEMTVTWNNQPPATSSNQVFLPATSVFNLDYLNINITALINDIITSGQNHGMLLRLANEQSTNLLAFCSEDHSEVAKRPRLKILYNCLTTSVNELQETGEVVTAHISDESIFVSFMNNRSLQKGRIQLTAADGKTLLDINMDFTSGLNQFTIPASGLNQGVYFLSIQGGPSFSRRKIIK